MFIPMWLCIILFLVWCAADRTAKKHNEELMRQALRTPGEVEAEANRERLRALWHSYPADKQAALSKLWTDDKSADRGNK